MIGQVSIAAATAIVGYDLCRDQLWKTAGYPRAIAGVGLCGSAAAGDTKVILYVGTSRIGEFYNLATGFPTKDHIIPVANRVPAGQNISAIVEDAPATNPINLTLELVP